MINEMSVVKAHCGGEQEKWTKLIIRKSILNIFLCEDKVRGGVRRSFPIIRFLSPRCKPPRWGLTENPFPFDTFCGLLIMILKILCSSFKFFLLSCTSIKDFCAMKETYRCRSSLPLAFIIANDTFWLMSHQVR